MRFRLDEERVVRRSIGERVRAATRLGGGVEERWQLEPHPVVEVPAGLGEVVASIVRGTGEYGGVRFAPGAGRVEVPMTGPAAVRGRVVDRSGAPVVDAVVRLQFDEPGKRAWAKGCRTTTAATGEFLVAAPASPPLDLTDPVVPLALPTSGFLAVETPDDTYARVSVSLLPPRVTIAGDIVVERKRRVTLSVAGRIRPTLGEVRAIAWSGRSTGVTAWRWDAEDLVVCELAAGTAWRELPGSAIVVTTTGTFAAVRDGEERLLGPTYRREFTLDVNTGPLERLVLRYEWGGASWIAAEFGPSTSRRLEWTATFPAPDASLRGVIHDLTMGAALGPRTVRWQRAWGRAEELGDTLEFGR